MSVITDQPTVVDNKPLGQPRRAFVTTVPAPGNGQAEELPPTATLPEKADRARWWSRRRQVSPCAAKGEDIDEPTRLPGHWQDFVCAQFSNVGVSFYR